MEWMYREHNTGEAPCCIGNKLPSDSNPISNFGNESSENFEIENTVSPVDYPDLYEEPVEETFKPLSPPASSESDVSSTTDIDYQQTNDASSLDENTIELFHNSDHMGFHRSDMTNHPNTMKTSVSFDNSTDEKDFSDNKKAETIKMLREEVVAEGFSMLLVLISSFTFSRFTCLSD